MPCVFDLDLEPSKGSRPPIAAGPALMMVAVAAASLWGGACTKPQSGLFAATWCSTDAGATVQLLDDLEDDDGKACAGQGSWSVVKGDGSGQTTPPQGPITMTADLLDSDLAVRPGRRALHLVGTGFGDGEPAALRVDLADGDLTGYSEIQFWARSDAAGALDFRVAVPTETTANNGGVYWGLPVTVTQKWGDGEGKAFSFPLLGAGDTMVPDDQKDLDHALGLEFQVRANADTSSFGFWIDDVVFIRKP